MKTILGFIILCLICVVPYGVGRIVARFIEGDWKMRDGFMHMVCFLAGTLAVSILMLLGLLSHAIGQSL